MEIEDEPLTEQKLINLYGSMAKDDLAKITCGFDRGVADSNGAHYDFDPVAKRRMETREKNRRRYQRKYARQNPGSKRSRKTRKRTESTYAYQADVRKEFAHKTSRKIVDSEAKVFVFEDLIDTEHDPAPQGKEG